MLSDCKFLRFTTTAMRFTSHFDGSLAPKVVQIIVSYNNLHAFFVIFRVFGGFFEIFGANFGLWACCSPTAEGCASLRASCSPPRWGGGELRGSKNRNNSHAPAKCGSQNRAGRSLRLAEARYSHSSFTRSPQAATLAVAEDKF